MLHLKKVLGAKPKEHVEATLEQLLTPWGEALDVQQVLQEHPEPMFARESFQMLNGPWKCAFVESAHRPDEDLASVVEQARQPEDDAFEQEIIVPFSPEALLSGVSRQLQPTELLWYRRSFEAPNLGGGERVILHFQAVDYACSVYVNRQHAGVHAGGYTPFSLDITDLLGEGGNELSVCVADSSEMGGRLRGKQRFDRGDIWYTAQSGIWQSVWYEVVPAAHLSSIVIEPDAATGILSVGAHVQLGEPELALRLEVLDGEGRLVASACESPRETTCAIAVHIPDVRPWSPDDPYLYSIRLVYGEDVVNSYCGFRSVEVRDDEHGVKRLFLNGEPLFIKGVLDQAYWSDGLMTAPSDEALVFDIEAMRAAGFNLMRKHIKVESSRWYYHCDRLGMLVLQDMVCGGDPEIKTWHWSYKPTLFKISWNHYRDDTDAHRDNLGSGDERYREEWRSTCREVMRILGNHPCIICWSLFNEGWGQFNAKDACAMARAQDPTRPIDATSGWYDQGCGDFNSVHNYFRDMKVWRDWRGHRAFFVSEFGGYTHRVEGHSALEEAYGYELYDDLGEWRSAVRSLLAQMDALEPKGLAGYIYTQVSDIEEETNGILTYDRRVNKLMP
ncbi:MAG: glycoside hydrolase family 2 [Eggerthellaceae bacterium]|nr:glycoside hydrolase family 2 [Eggerthellaceae bacterium]